MNTQLTTNLTTDLGDAAKWIDLRQEVITEDTATHGETADLLDALFSINPCVVNEPEPIPVPEITRDEFTDIVAQEYVPRVCDVNANNDYLVYLRLYLSDLSAPYKLVYSNGTSDNEVLTTDDINVKLIVDNASSVSLPFPADSDINYEWLIKIVVLEGSDEVTLSSDRRSIKWKSKITGTVNVTYKSSYYRIAVYVPSNEGLIEECTATAFSGGMVDELVVSQPDTDYSILQEEYCTKLGTSVRFPDPNHDVTCYEDITVHNLCQCSQALSHFTYERAQVPCPDGIRCYQTDTCEYTVGRRNVTNFVDCGEITGDINTPEFYEQNCCYLPLIPLPNCSSYTVTNRVAKPLEDSVRLYYERTYDNVSFIAVMPKDGYCGTTKYTQWIVKQNCCDGIPAITWDEINSVEVLSPESDGLIFVNTTKYPLTWKLRGVGVSFSPTSSVRNTTTDTQRVRIYTTDEFCSIAEIEVTDGCSTVVGDVRSTDGVWDFIGFFNTHAKPIQDYLASVNAIYCAVYAGYRYNGDQSRRKNKYYIQGWSQNDNHVGTIGTPIAYSIVQSVYGPWGISSVQAGCTPDYPNLSNYSLQDPLVGIFTVSPFVGQIAICGPCSYNATYSWYTETQEIWEWIC